jgi:hypothetical protein
MREFEVRRVAPAVAQLLAVSCWDGHSVWRCVQRWQRSAVGVLAAAAAAAAVAAVAVAVAAATCVFAASAWSSQLLVYRVWRCVHHVQSTASGWLVEVEIWLVLVLLESSVSIVSSAG